VNALQIKEFVEQNPRLVTCKESVRYPGLFVLKYHSRVFYDNLWTPELQEMRGLVVDANWNIVILPFTKIFNRFENGADIELDEKVIAVRKVNGFMAAATLVPEHGMVISTTGSTDSDFVAIAEKYLKNVELYNGFTYLFEICDPSDPHIVYEDSGAYLIGCRSLYNKSMLPEKDLDPIAVRLKVRRPEWVECIFSEVVAISKAARHEGFVVYGKHTTLKIKSPYYLIKKLFARIRGEKLTYPWFADAKQKLDEEYYPLIQHIENNRDDFIQFDEQARLEFIEGFLKL